MSESKFIYEEAKFEQIPCNLCGNKSFFVLAKRSANGRNAQTCLCKTCGLIFINPRMTGEWYDKYYKDYYRDDRELLHGHADPEGDAELNFKNAVTFGKGLGRRVKQFLEGGLTIDVGSSTGGTLFGLKEIVPSLDIFGIEPSAKESDFANDKGIKTFRGLFENFTPEFKAPAVSNILCVRSLNHLLEPRRFFEWSWKSLKDGGSLILYVKNFRYQARRAGSVAAGVQIDHPYMFTPESLKNFVESVGFTVVRLEDDETKTWEEIRAQKSEGLSAHHILLVAKKDGATQATGIFSDRGNYLKTLCQLNRFYLKLYYLAGYSARTAFLRKLLSRS